MNPKGFQQLHIIIQYKLQKQCHDIKRKREKKAFFMLLTVMNLRSCVVYILSLSVWLYDIPSLIL